MLASLSLIAAFAASVIAQGAPIAQTTLPNSPAVTDCTGCYVIANVAQVIFADFTSTETATAVVSQGSGRNGSVVTTTFVQQLPAFSFDQGGLISGQPVPTGAYGPLTGTVITIGGAALTSPTAYNVFTEYTVFSRTANGDGSCGTASAVEPVNPAISFEIGANDGPSAIFSYEESFIQQIPQLTCSAGGVFVSTTVPVAVTTTTTTSMTTGVYRPTPLPQTSGAASTTMDSGVTLVSSTDVVMLTPSASVSIITGGASSSFHPVTFSTSLLAAALFFLPALGAWLL